MNDLFITGLYRSGTTFLQKLLINQGVNVKNQVYQKYIFSLSEDFLLDNNIKYTLPIGPELDYKQSQLFSVFLEENEAKEQFNFSSKEIISEAFLPYLLKENFKCISIIRNPVEVLLSAQRTTEIGPTKPSYWHLLMWKRSSAFLFHLRKSKNHKILRFENLTLKTVETCKEICDWLEIPFYSGKCKNLKDESGKPWEINAAEGSLNPKDHKRLELIAQAVCYPEMKYWNYPSKISSIEEAIEVIVCFKDPVKVKDQRFLNQNFSYYGIDEILDRFKVLIQDKPSSENIKKYFYTLDYYQQLKSAL